MHKYWFYGLWCLTPLDLQLPVQSVPITTRVVSSNPVHGVVYSIQICHTRFIEINKTYPIFPLSVICLFSTHVKLDNKENVGTINLIVCISHIFNFLNLKKVERNWKHDKFQLVTQRGSFSRNYIIKIKLSIQLY
jgi:hypothetical protein